MRGKRVTIDQIENMLNQLISNEYQRGYEDGDSNQRENSCYEYERGLNDAWECARKIINMPDKKCMDILGKERPLYVFVHMLASEAIQKIKEYEEKQKDCRDCKKYSDCECGEKGHTTGTSQGYSTGECMDYKEKQAEIHCIHTDEEIADSFVKDVSEVKNLLPKQSEDKCSSCIHDKGDYCEYNDCFNYEKYEPKQTKNKCEPCNYRDVCSHDLDDYDCESKPTDEIKVGDEIRSELTDTNAIVHRIDAWNRYQCIAENGSQICLDKDTFRECWVKTGRRFDAIEKILEQMKER